MEIKRLFLVLSATVLLSPVVFLAACDEAPMEGDRSPVAMPPEIPLPEIQGDGDLTDADSSDSTLDSDAIIFPDVVRDKAMLAMLNQAFDKGLFTPEQAVQDFRPTEPVTRRDFALWLAKARGLDPANRAKVAVDDLNAADPSDQMILSVLKSGWMDLFPYKAGHAYFKPNKYISREEFCVVYVRIVGKMDEADELTEMEVDESHAAGGDDNPMETFEHITDISATSPVYRHYLAVAFRDNIFTDVFGLTSEQIFGDAGMQPRRSLTRQQAIRFLMQY